MSGCSERYAVRRFHRAAGVVLLALLASGTRMAAQDAPELIRLDRAWLAMGTLLRATAMAPDTMTARNALGAARVEVLAVDSLMNTAIPESELSLLNAAAGDGRWMPLSPLTLEVLEAALAWAERSEGAFDPTVGPLVRAWGSRGETRVPSRAEIDSLKKHVDWRAIEIEHPPGRRLSFEAEPASGARARITRTGVALDFGAILKGYTLDRAASAMAAAGVPAGRLDLGSLVTVFGRAPDGAAGWSVEVRDPRSPKEALGRMALDGGSVATTGDYEPFLEIDGRRYAHIIDSRTGEPVEGILQVTVVAQRGIDASALSTTLFILGPDEGPGFLEQWAPDATAIWVKAPEDEEIDEADIVVAGAGSETVEIEEP